MMKRAFASVALACLLSTWPVAWAQEGLEQAVEAARQGRVSEALESVDAALAAVPDDPRALFARGVILAENGRRDEAAQTFERLISLRPDLPEAYNNLAVIQAAAGDFDAAVATLKGALATDSSYQTAYENLTRIFAQLASEAYSRALEVETPPAREEVELVMLADLSVPATVSAAPEQVADARMAPVEPMLPMPAEPIAEPATGDDTAAAGAPDAPDEAASEAAPLESEDLEMAEMGGAAEDPAGVVDEWARAWSDQRVDDYLSFYAEDFVPDNGMSRSAWEANRRERLAAPEFIKVEVAILDSVSDGDDRTRITFLQAYESNSYSDQVTKTLTLVRHGSDWKILEEKSGS